MYILWVPLKSRKKIVHSITYFSDSWLRKKDKDMRNRIYCGCTSRASLNLNLFWLLEKQILLLSSQHQVLTHLIAERTLSQFMTLIPQKSSGKMWTRWHATNFILCSFILLRVIHKKRFKTTSYMCCLANADIKIYKTVERH